jgi:hypothetical protein
MKIRLESRGGVTGRAMVRQLVLDGLSPEARKLRKMLDEGQFWGGSESILSRTPKPWDAEHKLTVEDGGRTRTVKLHKSAAMPGLQGVIERMEELPPAG